jgi:hypothetical protein
VADDVVAVVGGGVWRHKLGAWVHGPRGNFDGNHHRGWLGDCRRSPVSRHLHWRRGRERERERGGEGVGLVIMIVKDSNNVKEGGGKDAAAAAALSLSININKRGRTTGI